MAMFGVGRPLVKIAEVFEELANTVNLEDSDLQIVPFASACYLVLPFLRLLDTEVQFAEVDFATKVNHLIASTPDQTMTIAAMVEEDSSADRLEELGSRTRTLLRVKRGLDMLKVRFEKLIESDFQGNCLKDATWASYEAVFVPYLPSIVTNKVIENLQAAPAWPQIKILLNEDDNSARDLMNRYIASSQVVLNYIDELLRSYDMDTNY